MAYTFTVNQTPATGAAAMYLLLTALVAAGWTKTKDSDGTTYSSSGAQVTTGAAGAGGLANNFAWFVLKHPTSNQAFCFQRSNVANTQWRISYCTDDAFTGGTPGATRIPAPTGPALEIIIIGGGTDAAPTFSTMFTTDGGYRSHIVVGGAAEGYSWTAWYLHNGTASGGGWLLFDAMRSGSYPVSDPDPYVVGGAISVSSFATFFNADSSANHAWMGSIGTIGNNKSIGMRAPGGNVGMGGTSASVGTNVFTSKDDIVPTAWIRSTAPGGWKGYSTLFLVSSVVRSGMDTLDVAGTRDYVWISGFVLPWDGSIPTI